jgi:hypothetical protein
MDILAVLPNDLSTDHQPGSTGLRLTATEVDGLMELAHLTTAVDNVFTAEEQAAFEALAGRLLGHDSDATHVLRELTHRRSALGPAGRLEAVARKLDRPEVAELAYKICFALSMVDLASDAEETVFDAEVVEALGIGEARAQDLANDVFEAFAVE